jgi:hypothetical protein
MKKWKHPMMEHRLYDYGISASVIPQTYHNTAAFAWEEVQ